MGDAPGLSELLDLLPVEEAAKGGFYRVQLAAADQFTEPGLAEVQQTASLPRRDSAGEGKVRKVAGGGGLLSVPGTGRGRCQVGDRELRG